MGETSTFERQNGAVQVHFKFINTHNLSYLSFKLKKFEH